MICYKYKDEGGKRQLQRCCHYSTLSSDNPNAYYGGNTHIQYYLYTQPNCKIELKFNQIRTICPGDYVKIYDDSGLIGNYCGRHGSKTIITSGPYAYLKFVTDGSKAHTGFKASFKKGMCNTTFSLERETCFKLF